VQQKPTLVIAPRDLSGALHSQPALTLRKSSHPHSPLVVIANHKVAALYSAMPEVAELIQAPTHLLTSSGLIAWANRLRQRDFKESFQLCRSRRAQALIASLNIENRHAYRPPEKNDGILGPSAEDFAALMLCLPSGAEIPINLPSPSLRPDAHWLRTSLAQWNIKTALSGTADRAPRLSAVNPLFLLQTSSIEDTGLAESLMRRWPGAVAVHIRDRRLQMGASHPVSISLADHMALISVATAVITDDVFAIQLSDAFSTPVISVTKPAFDTPSHWFSRQGRFARSSENSREIIQNMEKILRFDRQHQSLS
jgi:ADP-heptose:LPS heptosyltransferase